MIKPPIACRGKKKNKLCKKTLKPKLQKSPSQYNLAGQYHQPEYVEKLLGLRKKRKLDKYKQFKFLRVNVIFTWWKLYVNKNLFLYNLFLTNFLSSGKTTQKLDQEKQIPVKKRKSEWLHTTQVTKSSKSKTWCPKVYLFIILSIHIRINDSNIQCKYFDLTTTNRIRQLKFCRQNFRWSYKIERFRQARITVQSMDSLLKQVLETEK